jgi:hypothetical protein
MLVALVLCVVAIRLVIVLKAVMLRECAAYTYNVKLVFLIVALIEVVVKSLETCVGVLIASVVVDKGALESIRINNVLGNFHCDLLYIVVIRVEMVVSMTRSAPVIIRRNPCASLRILLLARLEANRKTTTPCITK